MRGRLLAAMILLVAMVTVARAEYLVIIANLNARPDTPPNDGAGGDSGTPPGGAQLGGNLGIAGGMIGGAAMGGPRGGMGGPIGGMMPPGGFGPGEDAADDSPYIIVAVVEVLAGLTPIKVKQFESGLIDKFVSPEVPGLSITHRWGKTALKQKDAMYEVIPLRNNAGQLLPRASRRFQQMYDQTFMGKPTADQVVKLAQWALEHGLLDEFSKVMERLDDVDKAHPAFAAYQKVKAELAKPVSRDDVAGKWKSKILDGYRVTVSEAHHYALIHNLNSDAVSEVKPQLDRLEKAFRSFYYWWALRGTVLPMPKERQVAVLTEKGDDFRRLKKHLTASPVVADSFSARREGLTVFAGNRNDDSFVTLSRVTKPLWDKGINRAEIIKGLGNPLLMKGAPRGTTHTDIQESRVYSLLMRALEEEWEATGMSHEASRQLVYAAGLLPRNVNVPEWIQFGLGSFFEVPLQSPFGGVGAPSPYWLPRFRESYKAKHYNKNRSAAPNPTDALVRVVTDAGFRSRPEPFVPQLGESPEAAAHRAEEAHTRRARSAAWSLTYFLAQRNLDGLRAYFKRLSKMPRDVELDEKVLLTCFARSFDCANADGSVRQDKLADLARRWIAFIDATPLESEAIHKKLREYYKQVTRILPGGGRAPGPPGSGQRGGLPGGLRPGGN